MNWHWDRSGMTNLRIAVVATPRSGNTWVRYVLGDALDLAHLAVHNYLDLPEELPERAILQIHWPREPNFQAFLRRHGFRIVSPCRHPLDTFLSVLHFVPREPQVERWLEGNVQIPPDFGHAAPTSPAFEQWAMGFGAENLLAVGYQWSFDQSTIQVRYEDLVESPADVFRNLIFRLGESAERLEEAVAGSKFARFQTMPNRHGWQGKPELWKQLIPSPLAQRIAKRHQQVFARLGYDVPFHKLSDEQAKLNWTRLVAA